MLSYLIQVLLGTMLVQEGDERYVILTLPWQLPSGKRTQTLTVPLLLVLGMWNIKLTPLLLQTGDLLRAHRKRQKLVSHTEIIINTQKIYPKHKPKQNMHQYNHTSKFVILLLLQHVPTMKQI